MAKKIIGSNNYAANKPAINYVKINRERYILVSSLGSYVNIREEPDASSGDNNVITKTDGTNIFFRLIGYKTVASVSNEDPIWYYIEFMNDYPAQSNIVSYDQEAMHSIAGPGIVAVYGPIQKDPIRGYPRGWINKSGVEFIAARHDTFLSQLKVISNMLDNNSAFYSANSSLDSYKKRVIRLRQMTTDYALLFNYDYPLDTDSSINPNGPYSNQLTTYLNGTIIDNSVSPPWSTTVINPFMLLFHQYTHFYVKKGEKYLIYDFQHIMIAIEGNFDISKQHHWPALLPVPNTKTVDTIWAGDLSAIGPDKEIIHIEPRKIHIKKIVFDWRNENSDFTSTFNTIIAKQEVDSAVFDYVYSKSVKETDLISDMVGIYMLQNLKEFTNFYYWDTSSSSSVYNDIESAVKILISNPTDYLKNGIKYFFFSKGFDIIKIYIDNQKVMDSLKYESDILIPTRLFTTLWWLNRKGLGAILSLPSDKVNSDTNKTALRFSEWLDKNK
jgi:hypothetical protein